MFNLDGNIYNIGSLYRYPYLFIQSLFQIKSKKTRNKMCAAMIDTIMPNSLPSLVFRGKQYYCDSYILVWQLVFLHVVTIGCHV